MSHQWQVEHLLKHVFLDVNNTQKVKFRRARGPSCLTVSLSSHSLMFQINFKPRLSCCTCPPEGLSPSTIKVTLFSTTIHTHSKENPDLKFQSAENCTLASNTSMKSIINSAEITVIYYYNGSLLITRISLNLWMGKNIQNSVWYYKKMLHSTRTQMSYKQMVFYYYF